MKNINGSWDDIISLMTPVTPSSEIDKSGIPLFNIVQNIITSYLLLESLHWILDKNRQSGKKSLLSNQVFFSTISYSLCMAVIIDLYRLVDKTSSSIKFSRVIDLIQNQLHSNEDGARIKNELAMIKKMIDSLHNNVKKVRNKFFAHNQAHIDEDSINSLQTFAMKDSVFAALEIFLRIESIVRVCTGTILLGILAGPDRFINERNNLKHSLIDDSLAIEFEKFYRDLINDFENIAKCPIPKLSISAFLS